MATESTTSQSTATQNGVTWTFDTSYPVGTFSQTDPDDVHIFVVNSGGLTITDDSPASATENGGVKNGMVRDPYFTSSQGFDEFIGAGTQSYILSANSAYDSNLNIAPSITGSNIVLSAGEEATFVKAVRLSSVTTPESWQTIEKYVHLHVLAAAPTLGAYPPSASGTTKTIWTRSDRDLTVLRSLTLPASFTDTESSLNGSMATNLGLWGRGGEYLRRFRLDVDNGNSSSNYSGDLTDLYAKCLMVLHKSGITTADRDDILDRAIQFGIQMYGLIERGGAGMFGGAGQGGVIGPWIYYSAAALGDSGMWTAAKDLHTQMVSAEWLQSGDVGRSAGGKSGKNAQTSFTEMTGTPIVIPDEWGTNHDTRYGVIADRIVAYESLAVSMLQNTPDASTGAHGILNGSSANDTTQSRAATIAFLDRYRTWTPWVFSTKDPTDLWRDLYDQVQPLTGLTAWTGVPDQVPQEDANFTAGDGSIGWNIGTLDFATETVTSRDMRYSLDAVQWLEETGVATSSSKTGLLKGAAHWCGFRQNSSSGNGAWGLNYPEDSPITSGTDRNKVTTTGTDTLAAPSNTTAPVIHTRLHPAWGYSTWTPASGTFGVNDTELAAGVGYWSGYPAPTHTYQWKRDAVNIAGETSQTYNRTASDAGTSITCEITATNSEGSASVTTAGVSAPAVQTPPSGTLIDTNFRGAFTIDYDAEWTDITENNCNKVHDYTETFSSTEALADENINYGTLKVDKTGAYPSIVMGLSRNLLVGTTYRIVAELVATEDWTGTMIFDFRRDGGGSSYLSGGQKSWTIDAAQVISINETFDIGGSEPDLAGEIQLGHTTATGGTAGGDPYITYLKIYEEPSPPSPKRISNASGALLEL